ncbi:MAG: hypothetical protein H6653_07565 [Ardenticatenaceae bacterium]|nr:hypothetical protein [Ardenticatenaceae bacterium]
MSETIELARQYYYSTPEQMKTFLNKFHKGSGLLYLTEKSITLENAPFVLDIPLATINSIKIEYFSRWIKPIPTAYLDVTYIEAGLEKTILLVPDSLLIWDINKHLKNWVATFEQIDALKEKIKRPLPPLATSPTSEHILILILAIIGAGLLIAGAASLLRLLF